MGHHHVATAEKMRGVEDQRGMLQLLALVKIWYSNDKSGTHDNRGWMLIPDKARKVQLSSDFSHCYRLPSKDRLGGC